MSDDIDTLIERLRYTAAILDANKGKFAVPNHIPQKANAVREAADMLGTLPALLAEREVMIEALKPFAAACTISNREDDENIDDSIAATKITFGHLRTARKSIKDITGHE